MPARFGLILVAALLLPAAGRAASPFETAVGQIGAALHARPEHSLLLGMAGWFVRRSHPHQAAGLHLAYFQAPAGLDLAASIGPVLGRPWSRMVSTVRRRDHEQDLVYVRQEGKHFELLVLSLDDDNQLAVVTLRVDSDELLNQVEKHRQG